MKSNLTRFVGCVTFAALALGATGARAQSGGVPRLISYQGLMMTQNQVPITGQHLVEVKYYDASSGGAVIGDEIFRGVAFQNGAFDLSLGGAFTPPEFPARFTFAQPVWLAITLDPGSSSEQVFPRQELLSAPYAMNAERANGLQVTAMPVNGALWPVPVDGTGKIDASVLPVPTSGVATINAVGPDAGGGISLLPGNGISILPNASTHTITISAAPASDVIVTVGTTAQHPATPVQGTIRFNTTTGKFEGYDGSAWVNLN